MNREKTFVAGLAILKLPELCIGCYINMSDGSQVRVMAYTEGYYVVRKLKAAPYLIHKKDLSEQASD